MEVGYKLSARYALTRKTVTSSSVDIFFFRQVLFKSEHDVKKENLRRALQPTFTYSKSTTETTEQYVKIVRSFR